MITFSPKSITATESDPLSVVSYDVKLTVTGGVGDLFKSQGADPTGVTVIPINDLFTPAMVGKQVNIFARQVGPSGAITAYQAVGGTLNIVEIPDGAENITVQL
jgi:hypothetical protein